MGLIGAIGVIIASMVGSGIFSLTGQFGASVASGFNLEAVWIVGGAIALCGGLSLAELGAMMPCSGGSVEFARRAFGPLSGYLVAMVTIIAGYILSITVIGLFLAGMINQILPGLAPDWVIAMVMMVVALATQVGGLRMGFGCNTAFSIAKVLFILGFILAGLLVRVDAPLEPAVSAANQVAPGLLSSAVASATLAVSFAYLGWSAGADVAGEIKAPGRTLPRAMIIAITLVMLLYVGMNLVYLRAMNPLAMVEPDGSPMKAVGAVAARTLFGVGLGDAMTVVISALLFSTIVPLILSGARVLESMAHAREVPAWLGHRRANGVPLVGLLVVTGLSIAALGIGSLGEILDLLTILITVFSSLSVAAVIVLRRTMPDAPRPFRVPWYPLTPLVYLGLSAWSVVASVSSTGWRGVIVSSLTVVGLLIMRPLLAR